MINFKAPPGNLFQEEQKLTHGIFVRSMTYRGKIIDERVNVHLMIPRHSFDNNRSHCSDYPRGVWNPEKLKGQEEEYRIHLKAAYHHYGFIAICWSSLLKCPKKTKVGRKGRV